MPARFWLPDDDASQLLLNLETLRLQNWIMPGPYFFDSWIDETPHIADLLYRFIAARPKLTDISILDFPADMAERLADDVLSQRPMKRVLVGDEAVARSRAEYIDDEDGFDYSGGEGSATWSERLPGALLRRRQGEWMEKRKQNYLDGAWRAYGVHFHGLALDECGYRPDLMHQRCPRGWRDYLRRY